MKNFRLFLLAAVCLLSFSSCSQQEREPEIEQKRIPYRITGSVKNCEGCEVKLSAMVHRKFERIDSTMVKDGSFVLEGFIPETGVYTAWLNHPRRFVTAKIYLPADSVHLTIDAENKVRTKFYSRDRMGSWLRHGYVTSSSHIQGEIDKYLLTSDSLWNKAWEDETSVREKYRQTFDSGDPALVQLWADSLENFGNRFANYWSYAADLTIRKGTSPEVALFAMMENRNDRMATDRFKSYLAALPTEYQQSPQGQYMSNYLAENEQRNKNNQRFVNSRIRDLNLKGSTPQGIEVDESEIFKANKLTLVEFWASWCAPCRMVMPEYYELYEQYRDKGMGFIAVSMDNRREMWLKAIEQDGFDIHHVSELKGARGDDMRRFEIKGIPANMLVDDTGKIVAVDISRIDLRDKLKESL